MSDPITTSQGVVDRHEFDVWFHQFQGPNVSWNVDQRLIAGNFFIGLQAWNAQIFVMDIDIPAGAEILSASATYITHQTGIGDPIEILLNTPWRGNTYGTLPLLDPFGHRSWRQQFWVANEVLVRNSSNNQIGQSPTTPAVPDNSWALWQQDSGAVGLPEPPDGTIMRQRFGTKMTGLDPVGGGGQQLDYIRAILSQNGSLPGGTEIFFEIVGNEVVHGINLPDDTNVLATSDPVLASTVGATNAHDFNFSGADQITIDIGQLFHAVIRIEPEPPVNGFEFISLHSKSAFGIPTQHSTYGAGVGFDWQNWPGTADLATSIVGPLNNLGDNVLWSPTPFPAVGSSHTTPDITALVQKQVDHPFYEDAGRVLILSQYTIAQNPQNRVWASFNSALDAPIIDVTWRPRDGGGGPGHGNVILESTGKIEKVPPMSDDQLALLAVTVIEEFE